MDKIYPDLQSAKEACAEYVEKIWELRDKMGVSEECDDSCCAVHISAKYYDDRGGVRAYWWS